MNFELSHLGRRPHSTVFGSAVDGDDATVRVVDTGEILCLSRLDGEDGWTVDTAFGPDGRPLWVHAYGTRTGDTVTAPQPLADALTARCAERAHQ
ncbi:Uncharacterised protein [Nocardia otitidiscaviarum]|uniref:Uncharacterized protein n=1 Tax=Nocardia otitidiscaviarum TaxID=1823 RepID=A0A379JMG2_9NOCA|nr:hypothetical protein [Nocardia otitidiscaviarum]SUD49534.1 Uncharacterised protein [Nocardia otitidiscaviarum]